MMCEQSLMLSEDHPLIRAGFRGMLRLPDGTRVKILGQDDCRVGAHLIPRRDRRALQFVADGCGPDELAEVFDLPSERAERLYDAILIRYGLATIANQVKVAMSLSPPEPRKSPHLPRAKPLRIGLRWD